MIMLGCPDACDLVLLSKSIVTVIENECNPDTVVLHSILCPSFGPPQMCPNRGAGCKWQVRKDARGEWSSIEMHHCFGWIHIVIYTVYLENIDRRSRIRVSCDSVFFPRADQSILWFMGWVRMENLENTFFKGGRVWRIFLSVLEFSYKLPYMLIIFNVQIS